MRLFGYLRQARFAALLILFLLCVQAVCDLSLPTLTGNIVSVGLQQSGIEHASPDVIDALDHDRIAALLDDPSVIDAAYDRGDDGTYVLNRTGLERRDELDATLSVPLAVLSLAGADGGEDLNARLDALVGADAAQRTTDAAAIRERLGTDDPAIIGQMAIAGVRAVYVECGVDVTAIQLGYLLRTGLIMLGITFVAMIVSVAIGFLASRTGAKLGRDLRRRFFDKVVSFGEAEIRGFSAASLITRGTNDITQIQNVCVMLLRMVLYAPILAVGGIVMVMVTAASLSWIIGLAVVAVLLLVGFLMIFAMPKFRMMQRLIDQVNLVSREIITGQPVIRAFNRQLTEEARFDVASTSLMKTQLFTNRTMSLMMPMMMLIMNITSIVIVWVAAGFVDAGTLQVGSIIALLNYAMVIIMGFLMLSMISVMLPRADVAAQRIDEVLSTPLSVDDPDPAQSRHLAATGGLDIEFDDVDFSYAGSDEPVLQGLSFHAEAGKTTAFIGATGCGKSTVLKLIERFYDATGGTIRIDGVDIRSIPQHELRAAIGFVPQKAFLFSGTVEQTVAFRGDLDDAAVETALDIAQASSFIDDTEGGTQAAVSQGGANFSGGQRQRLAIARALAGGARAFLFDDSFSALDYATDAALRRELSQRLSDATVIIVAQRVSSTRNADNIVVLDEGRIVGQGTHDRLMRDCEAYREIALSQLSAEELGGGEN